MPISGSGYEQSPEQISRLVLSGLFVSLFSWHGTNETTPCQTVDCCHFVKPSTAAKTESRSPPLLEHIPHLASHIRSVKPSPRTTVRQRLVKPSTAAIFFLVSKPFAIVLFIFMRLVFRDVNTDLLLQVDHASDED